MVTFVEKNYKLVKEVKDFKIIYALQVFVV